ncbi:hypothetical protein ARMSODRAFT_978397 [Armillaria solidipes]|uniref:Uncharacterized protein n=1 Tax=Armillaria solidipes TaxID=1076256 RepID=A0A2H3B334_9AGAR|nr:hypothetical protein ARMSODRAFT_978397 [Armillaria solidipes]
MKGWLSGPQQEFIEQNYLQTFCKYHLEDPGRLKNYAKTAANGLLVKFGWRRPFNVPPMPVEVEDVLTPEDAAMKGAVVARLYPSMLSWLTRNANRVDAPIVKKSVKTREDPTTLLLNRLVGLGDIGLKGQLPFQAWASSLAEDSELVVEFTSQREELGLNQRQRMGLYVSFFAKAFAALPEEEQVVWRERVEEEKAAAREERNTANGNLGVLLPPAEALLLMDRLPKIIGPVCEQFSAMAGVAVCVMFGGPDPRMGGKSSVKSFSYGSNKQPIPEKFSANEPRFERCMGAFSDFVAECYDEDDEKKRALPVSEDMDVELRPSSSRRVDFQEIDPNVKEINPAAVECESMGAEDAEEHEGEVNQPSKKRKKRAKNDDGGEGARPKKQRKKGKGGGVAFASNERGKKTLKVGPKTTMEPRAALKQISNSLAAVMGPSAAVPPSPQPNIVRMPITGPNDTPNPFAAPHLVLKHPLMPPPIPPPGFKIPENDKATSRESSLVADGDNDQSEDGPVGPPPSDSLSREASPSPEVFGDALLLDSSKWEPWFATARGYLDQFELGHEWTLAIISFTLWEGRNGFAEGTRSLPTLDRRPKQVGWWSQRHRSPVPKLGRPEILEFEKKWWSWWRALQPSWRKVTSEEGHVVVGSRTIEGEWEKLACPGKNGMYSILACLAWWKRGIDDLSGNKGRLVSDWEAALDEVGWVLTDLSRERSA